MKPIDKMTSVDKARLLHELFPGEIPAFVDFVQQVCQTIRENEAQERAKEKCSISTFEFWHNLVYDTDRRIERLGDRLHERSNLFADQLFNERNLLFSQYCLSLYVGIRKHENQTFTDLVKVLFTLDVACTMDRTEEFKNKLLDLEQCIENAVAAELRRIGRPVRMDEFAYIPFSESVGDYIEAIRLDKNGTPVLDCSFEDVKEKPLSSVSHTELDHWDMIALVELLINIQPFRL